MPIWAIRLLPYLVGALLIWGAYEWAYSRGEAHTQAKWDESVERGRLEVERLKSEAGKITVRTETEYVEVEKVIRVKGDTIVKQVPVYVPLDLPDLPGPFRLLHDAAASQSPLPETPRGDDGAPVSPQAVAATVADNYATCHQNAARLSALQGWADEQYNLNPGD